MTVPQVNIADAIALTQERQRQAEIDRRLCQLPAAAMADCITSGLAGLPLVEALNAHFAHARRGDVYLAIGLAVAVLQADLVIAHAELDMLRNGGAAA